MLGTSHFVKKSDRDRLRDILYALSPNTFYESPHVIYAGLRRYHFTTAGDIAKIVTVDRPKIIEEDMNG